ncbi:MAG: hypothetical protein QM651_17920 [Rhodoblastus sp.]
MTNKSQLQRARKRKATHNARKRGAAVAEPPPPPPSPPPRAWWRSLVAQAGGALAVAAAFYTFAPLGPTAPTIRPGAPGAVSPFDSVFEIGNESHMFAIADLRVRCHVAEGRGPSDKLARVDLMTTAVYTIASGGGISYKCYYPLPIRPLWLASIKLSGTYRNSLFGWKLSEQSFDEQFVWDISVTPPRWLRGSVAH